ncbi:flavin reductase [Pedobacter sp. SD-b]|uniref:Flavin reductase n=1 Tax=Pedobacter segetis TaxID=2793069 RepID=A0ABS1BKD8_9SPHI|nr:flavin reductase [Pedobacter segetis]MBK0383359.1 flavin reductase [Pedobacter segetis]
MREISSAEISQMEQRFRTTFINSISGFKSLQMVGTINSEGNTNLALFSSIFHVGANPPYLGMVVRPDGNEHETIQNIMFNKCYTLNNVTIAKVKNAHQTSARYLAGQSEFKECGFTEEYVKDFAAPFVKESSIKIGLEFKEYLPFLLNKTKIVIGEIKHILIDDDLIKDDGFVDLAAASSVTSAGLDAYYSTSLINRFSYAKPGKQVEELVVNNNED